MKRKIFALLIAIFLIFNFSLTIRNETAPTVTIKEIQSSADAEGASKYKGQIVTARGIVTAVGEHGFYIQDGSGPWAGIWVYASPDVTPGDFVEVTGRIDEYYGMTEFNQPEYKIIGKKKVPEPLVLKTGQVAREKYEGVLVKVENLTVTNPDAGYGEWVIDDGSGELKIDGNHTGDPSTPGSKGDKITCIIGPVTFDYGEFKIEPKEIKGLTVSFPKKGKIGEPFIYPENMLKKRTHPGHLLKEDVRIKAVKNGIILEFETNWKVSDITVKYGIYSHQVLPQLPQFSMEVSKSEKTAAKKHEIVLDLSKLKINGETIINYRLIADGIPYGGKFKVKPGENGFQITPFIIEGPFVDKVTAGGAVISWDTNVETGGQVIINGQSFSDQQLSTHHEVKVSGLGAETTYLYRIKITRPDTDYSWTSQNYYFKTASVDKRFKFAFMGDGRSEYAESGLETYGASFNYDTVSDLLIDAFQNGSDFVVFGGDLIDGYTASAGDFQLQLKSWKDAAEIVGPYLAIYEVMGNHENLYDSYNDGSKYGLQFDKAGENSAEALFAREFVNPVNGPQREDETAPPYDETAYYFDYDNARIIVINTNYWWCSSPEKYGGNLEGFILENQMAWIKELLKEAEENPHIDHVIPIMHEPPFPNGGHLDDSMWYDGQKDYVFKMRDELWKAFSECSKVTVVLASHEHNYSRLLVNSNTPVYTSMLSADYERPIWQITSGGAGAPKYDREYAPWSSYLKVFLAEEHYVQVIIKGKELSVKVYDKSGKILDEKTLSTVEEETSSTVKFATFNIEDLTTRQVQTKGDPQASAAAKIIQLVNPDVLVLNEITNNLQEGKSTAVSNVQAFINNYLQVPQEEGLSALDYKYIYFGKSNTGAHSGYDLNNDGIVDNTPGDCSYGEDSFGYGEYPGQYAMALLSKYPIEKDNIRTFRKFLWKDMPGNKIPENFYSQDEIAKLRLSSKSHWDVPININGEIVHVLVAHPTPPVFDGPENRNGRRNHDEIRLIADYIDGKDYIYDDQGQKGGLPEDAKFVVMGDMNANPGEKDNYNAAALLLDNPRINSEVLPVSQGGINKGIGSRCNTSGGLHLDYVLPSANMEIIGSAVFWPGIGPGALEIANTVKLASDHYLVWVEIKVGK